MAARVTLHEEDRAGRLSCSASGQQCSYGLPKAERKEKGLHDSMKNLGWTWGMTLTLSYNSLGQVTREDNIL